MEAQLNKVDNYLDLKFKLESYTSIRAKEDFLTFVKQFAPTLVSDFKMG